MQNLSLLFHYISIRAHCDCLAKTFLITKMSPVITIETVTMVTVFVIINQLEFSVMNNSSFAKPKGN